MGRPTGCFEIGVCHVQAKEGGLFRRRKGRVSEFASPLDGSSIYRP